MKEKKKSDLAVLLEYTGSYKGLTFLGLGLSAVAMVLGMLPYICIWLVARDLIAVAPPGTLGAWCTPCSAVQQEAADLRQPFPDHALVHQNTLL